MAYALDAAGQYMQQEPAYELRANEPNPAFAALIVCALREHDLAMVDLPDTLVANRRSVGIPTQVLQNLRRPAHWRLGVDHPVVLIELALALAPGIVLTLRVVFDQAAGVRVRQRL